MTKSLRRGTLCAFLALAVLPAAASAAFTPTVAVNAVDAGCQPKAPLAFKAPGGGGNVAATQYTIVAVTGGTQSTSCGTITSVNDADSVNFISWNQTLGADSYRVFRGSNLIATLPDDATTCQAQTGNVKRCSTIDTGAGAGTPGTTPGGPAPNFDSTKHPDLNITEAFNYGGTAPNGNETTDPKSASLKDDLLHFPAGLAANVTSAPSCPLTGASSLLGDKTVFGTQDPNEDTCPAATNVGSLTTVINTPAGPRPAYGNIYVGDKLGTETARLYVVLHPACSAGYPAPLNPGGGGCTAALGSSAVETEKSFLSAIATIRSDGSFGIDNERTSIATGEDKDLAANTLVISSGDGKTVAGQVPIQVASLTQSLYGSAIQGTADAADDKPFIALPSSCAAKTFAIDAASYLDQALAHADMPFQATNCGALPYAPTFAIAVDGTGQQQQNGHPKVVAAITQKDDEAATKRTAVTLPQGLGTNFAALGNACKQADLNGAGCPATSKVGTAQATTPLLPGILAGDVFLAESATAGNLPNLEVFLKGAASIHLTGVVTFNDTRTRLVNTFDNLPEVPLDLFVLTVDGGPNGLLNNAQDLCNGLGAADAVFNGYNGKNTTVSSPVALTGVTTPCAAPPPNYNQNSARPKFSVKAKGVKKGRPTLAMSIKRGSAVKPSNPRVSRVTLPKGMKFTKKGKKRTVVKVNGKRVKTFKAKRRRLTIRSKSRTRRISVRTKRGAVEESRKIRRKGKQQRLKFKARVKVQDGKTYRITKRVKPRS